MAVQHAGQQNSFGASQVINANAASGGLVCAHKSKSLLRLSLCIRIELHLYGQGNWPTLE